MTAGLIVHSDTGTIQITDDLVNFVLLDKGTVTLGSPRTGGIGSMSYTSGPAADILVPNTLGYPPLIAFYSTTPISIFETVLDGANWRFTPCGEYGTAGGSQVEWFAFGPCPNVLPASFGLEVYRADGTLAYHSGYLPLRVRLMASGSGNVVNYSNTSLPTGRKYAVAVNYPQQEFTAPIPSGTWRVMHYATALQSLANGVNYITKKNTEVIYSFNPGYPGYLYPDWSILVLDVTGY